MGEEAAHGADGSKDQPDDTEAQLQRQCKIKDLIVLCFTFLKHNMVPGQAVAPAMQSFYTAVMRIMLVVLKDYP